MERRRRRRGKSRGILLSFSSVPYFETAFSINSIYTQSKAKHISFHFTSPYYCLHTDEWLFLSEHPRILLCLTFPPPPFLHEERTWEAVCVSVYMSASNNVRESERIETEERQQESASRIHLLPETYQLTRVSLPPFSLPSITFSHAIDNLLSDHQSLMWDVSSVWYDLHFLICLFGNQKEYLYCRLLLPAEKKRIHFRGMPQ